MAQSSYGTFSYLLQVPGVIRDDCISQHQACQVDEVVPGQRAAVRALHAQPQVVVEGNVQEQDVPRNSLALQTTNYESRP